VSALAGTELCLTCKSSICVERGDFADIYGIVYSLDWTTGLTFHSNC